MPTDAIPSMTRRRDHRSHNIDTNNPFPVVTRGMMADALHLQATHTVDEINQPIFALLLARKSINDARLACSAAKRQWSKDDERAAAVRDRLDAVMATLRQTMEELPLAVR